MTIEHISQPSDDIEIIMGADLSGDFRAAHPYISANLDRTAEHNKNPISYAALLAGMPQVELIDDGTLVPPIED